MTRPIAGALARVAVVVALVTGCGGDRTPSGPMVGRIDEALDAVESYYGAPQDYYEVSATADFVEVIVATQGGDEQVFWAVDDGLSQPVPIDVPDRAVFGRGGIDFDPDEVLGRLDDELPDSEIIDFAVTAAGSGSVIYDARMQSRQGGVLLVLLAGDGTILGAQAE